MLEFVPLGPTRTALRQHVDQRLRERHHDRRVGRDNKLRSVCGQLMEAADEREAADRRHSCFRLIEYVEPIPTKTMQREGQERLSVRYLMKWSWPICWSDLGRGRWFVVKALDFSRYVKEALGSQKEACPRTTRTTYEP